jgi:tryptophan-rich sensory protein
MNNVSVSRVSSQIYKKLKTKKRGAAFIKRNAKHLKKQAFFAAVSALFYLTVFFVCFGICGIKSLWFDTIIKPSFMPASAVFIAVNAVFCASTGFVFYKMLCFKDRAGFISLIINGFFYALIAYMFFCLKSPLGSFIILFALIAHTVLLASNYKKDKRLYAFVLALLSLWQVYILFVVYTILMLN